MDRASGLTSPKPSSGGVTSQPTDPGANVRPQEGQLHIQSGLSGHMNDGMSLVAPDSKAGATPAESGPLIFNPHFTPTEQPETRQRPERRKAITNAGTNPSPKPSTLKERVAELVKKVNSKLSGTTDRKSPEPHALMTRHAMLSGAPQHKQLRADFLAFCEREFSTENIQFVQDVEAFLDNPTAQHGQKIARESADVNLGSRINEILVGYTKGNPADMGDDALNKLIETLYEGQEVVLKMVTSDTLQRFLKDPQYAHHAQ